MAVYFISDMHFGDLAVMKKYDKRPFKTLNEMEEVMINNWNERVLDNDTVYILGDMFHKSVPVDKVEKILSQLNGKKSYVAGNHDQVIEQVRGEWFQRIVTYGADDESIIQIPSYKDTETLEINGWEVILSHYPISANKNTFNSKNKRTIHLYGHVHNSKEEKVVQFSKLVRMDYKHNVNKNLSVNVGCMMSYMDYTPRTLDELIDIAKCENETLFSIRHNSYAFISLNNQLKDLEKCHDDWLLEQIANKDNSI